MTDLRHMIDLSRFIGGRVPLWNQGKGSNLSVKTEDGMWIKGTGSRLADITEIRGATKLDHRMLATKLAGLTRLPENAREEAYAEAIAQSALTSTRPSMESGLHSSLSAKWVLHFHSLPSILMSHVAGTDLEALLALAKQYGFPKLGLLPALLPGWELASRVAEIRECSVGLLENHGIIVMGEEVGEVKRTLERWQEFERVFCETWKFRNLAELCSLNVDAWDPFLSRLAKREGDLKVYFPDAVIFQDALKEITAAGKKGRRLIEGAWKKDRNATELWLATLLLNLDCPKLREFPSDRRAKLMGLPTERVRVAGGRK